MTTLLGEVVNRVRFTPRTRGRFAVLASAPSLLAGLLAMTLGGAWRDRTDSEAAVRLERQGIAYLHPLTTLVGQLVQTQTAAVRGEQIDITQLRKAIGGVYAVNGANGAALGANQRFRDLNTEIEAAIAGPGEGKPQLTPAQQMASWSAAVALAVKLVQAIGESSGISFDPHVDAFYLAQAVTLYLPDAMMQAGRATDLATLANSQRLTGDNAVRAGVARYAVSADAEATTDGLNRSVGSTDNRQLGSKVTPPLVAFRAAVTGFTPPTAVAQPDSVTAAQLRDGAKAIFTTALPLTHLLLGQLGELMTARATELSGTRRNQLTAAAVAGLAVLLAVIAIAWRRRTGKLTTGAPPTSTPPAATSSSASSRHSRQPALSGSAPAGSAPSGSSGAR